jgi:phage terminase large subunit
MKSHFFAETMVESAVINPALRAVCLREVQKSLSQSVRQLILDKIEKFGVGHLFEVPRDNESAIHILDRTGQRKGRIDFQGLQTHTKDTIKSLEGYDIAWVEEAQSVSQRSLDMLRPTIRKPGSEIWFSYNPDKPDDPVDALFRGPHPPRGSIVIEVNYTDNPWLPDELREEMEGDRERDPDKYAHVWLGGYQGRSDARVFRNWRVQEFDSPRDAVFRFGADWGFAIDPTVLVRGFIGRWDEAEQKAVADQSGRCLFIDYEAYEVGCDVDLTPRLFDTVPRSRDFRITADSARPEVVSYMQRHGFPKIVRAVKGQGSIEDGIAFLQSFEIVIHPRCEHAAREVAGFGYKIDKRTDEILPFLDDKDNHVIDAMRYALEGLRRAGPLPKPDLAPKAVDRYARLRERSAGEDNGMY